MRDAGCQCTSRNGMQDSFVSGSGYREGRGRRQAARHQPPPAHYQPRAHLQTARMRGAPQPAGRTAARRTPAWTLRVRAGRARGQFSTTRPRDGQRTAEANAAEMFWADRLFAAHSAEFELFSRPPALPRLLVLASSSLLSCALDKGRAGRLPCVTLSRLQIQLRRLSLRWVVVCGEK